MENNTAMNEANDFSIVFMGTPQFAVASLEHLINAGIKVKAVVTIPDKPAGRGLKLMPSPVKEFAVSKGIKVLQPEKLKDESFIRELKKLRADLFVVVAFRMLPEVVWNMPPKGTINLHASLLPQYRGAAPINWAVMNGEKQTGVTTFFIEKEIDTGKIIDKATIEIDDDDNAGTVHDRLMITGAELLTKTVEKIRDGKATAMPQEKLFTDASQLKSAPKIFKETCRINWHNSCESIYNMIRGLSPYPAAYTHYFDEKNDLHNIKVYSAQYQILKHNKVSGYIETDNKKYLHVYCKDGYIKILELQLPGRKRMGIEELLRGYRFTVTERMA